MVLMSIFFGLAQANPEAQENGSEDAATSESGGSAETETESASNPITETKTQSDEDQSIPNSESSDKNAAKADNEFQTEDSDNHAAQNSSPIDTAPVEPSIDIPIEATEEAAKENSVAEWLTNLAGHLEVGVQFHYLPDGDEVKGFETLSFEGTPQFALNRGSWGKFTSGLAYRVNSSNSTEIRFTDDYIGPVFGFHSGPFTSDLILAYYNHDVFLQQEIERFSDRNEVLYNYLDLGLSQGIMPKIEIGLDFGQTGILLSAARPFQIDGTRDQGELADTWRANANLSWKTLLFGYQYNSYKGQEEHVLTIGSDLSLNF